MFDRGTFDRMPFDRGNSEIVESSMLFTGTSNAVMKPMIKKFSDMLFVGSSDLMLKPTIKKISDKIIFKGTSNLSIDDGIIKQINMMIFRGGSDLKIANGKLVIHSKPLVFEGSSSLEMKPIRVIKSNLNFMGCGDFSIVDSIVKKTSSMVFVGSSELSMTSIHRKLSQLEFQGSSNLQMNSNMKTGSKMNFSGSSSLLFMPKIKANPQMIFVGSSDMSIEVGSIKSSNKALFYGGSNLRILAEIVRLEELFVNVTLQPNDILIVDNCAKEVYLNGVSVIKDWSGEWFDIDPFTETIEVTGSGNTKMDFKSYWNPERL